jgi:hypothetical protein
MTLVHQFNDSITFVIRAPQSIKNLNPQSIIDLSNNVPKARLRTFRDEQIARRIISKRILKNHL